MTIRIQCPACERQFKVGEELKGRTVECGACEHRFKLDEGVVIAKRDKFYPGEKNRPGLEAFGRSQRSAPAPVAFETADYNQTQSVAEFVPMSPQKTFATALGTALLAMTAILFIIGTMENGMLKDVDVAKRTILAGFIVAVGAALVLYGCSSRRKTGILISVSGVGITLALALFMPVPKTIDPNAVPLVTDETVPPDEREDPRGSRAPMTAEEVMNLVGYGPVKRAIAKHTVGGGDGSQFVTAIWVPVMEERFKFQILKYLHRKTESEERPSFYRRKEGGLFVIDGPRISLERMAGLVERFGRVEEVYPELRILEVMVEGSRLIEASNELMNKLTDRDHPAFYTRNLDELDHIDLDRVSGAVQRLSDVEPLRFRVEISRRLVELLSEESEPDFKGDICRALMVWSEEGDGAGADEAVARAAKELMGRGEDMPRAMLEFMVKRKSPEVVPIVELLWMENPTAWEPIVADIGEAAEDAVLKHLHDKSAGVRLSAVQLLKRIGTKKSIEPLRALVPDAGDEMKVLLEEVIASLEG